MVSLNISSDHGGFGHHDVSGVRAHTGGAAREAAGQLGARAYAVGSDIAFAGTPDLHTAAHEAAHCVQQRTGVALKGGIDQPGDEHERHADQVADAVVRGQSAEPLLDRIAGRGATAAPAPMVVQRKPDGKGPGADAPDVLPSPVMLQVLGDRFKLTFRRGAERRLYCDVHYEGALTASAPFLKDNTVQVSSELEDPSRAFNAPNHTLGLDVKVVTPEQFFKADLIAETPGMTSTQVHSESSMLATRHEKQLAVLTTSDGAKGEILIDKRLAGVADVQAYAKMAKDTGRKFVLYDVDAPLETSLAGVLERVPGGADPLPPFDVVADGFVRVRTNRKPVIDMFTADPSFGDYVLYGTTSSGQRVEVATVTGPCSAPTARW